MQESGKDVSSNQPSSSHKPASEAATLLAQAFQSNTSGLLRHSVCHLMLAWPTYRLQAQGTLMHVTVSFVCLAVDLLHSLQP